MLYNVPRNIVGLYDSAVYIQILVPPLFEGTWKTDEIWHQEEPAFTQGTNISRLYWATLEDIEFQPSVSSDRTAAAHK
jgi:hypothetical protein